MSVTIEEKVIVLTLELICSNFQVTLDPFTVIRSIDRLAETLADMLFAEKRGFTLSTKNISKTNLLSEFLK